jgi:hypothetical protein
MESVANVVRPCQKARPAAATPYFMQAALLVMEISWDAITNMGGMGQKHPKPSRTDWISIDVPYECEHISTTSS